MKGGEKGGAHRSVISFPAVAGRSRPQGQLLLHAAKPACSHGCPLKTATRWSLCKQEPTNSQLCQGVATLLHSSIGFSTITTTFVGAHNVPKG
jgi:hypothetical protein